MGALFCEFRVFSAHFMLHKESRYRDESAQNSTEMMDLCPFEGHWAAKCDAYSAFFRVFHLRDCWCRNVV